MADDVKDSEVSDVSEQDARLSEAHDMARTYMYTAMSFGLIPVPAVDFAAISLTQLKMIHSLAAHYEVEFSKNVGKSIVGSLVGGALPTPLAVGAASMVKAIPIIGPLFGAVGVPIFAGASTYALSRVFIQHFESGGTFLDLNPEDVREYFAEQFKKGEGVAKDMKKSKAAA